METPKNQQAQTPQKQQQRDERGHFLPTPGSPKFRIAELEKQLAEVKSLLEAVWLALPDSWRPADRAKLLDSVKLFAAGWLNLQGRMRDTEKQLADATSALRLSERRAGELAAEREALKAALSQAGVDIEQERRAGWVETRVIGIVTAVVVGLVSFFVGRWGR